MQKADAAAQNEGIRGSVGEKLNYRFNDIVGLEGYTVSYEL